MFQLRWHGIVVVCGRPVGTGTVVTVEPRGYLQWCRCGDGLGIAVLVSHVYNEWGPSVLYMNQICIIQPNYKLGVFFFIPWDWVPCCGLVVNVLGANLQYAVLRSGQQCCTRFATQMLFRRSGSELFDTFKNIILLRIFPL